LRRETFQISPQLPQRQYVLASGVRAVVVIEPDWHAGHTVGMLTAAIAPGRNAVSFPKRDRLTPHPSRRHSASEPRVENDAPFACHAAQRSSKLVGSSA
jgi:hypothetical protein